MTTQLERTLKKNIETHPALDGRPGRRASLHRIRVMFDELSTEDARKLDSVYYHAQQALVALYDLPPSRDRDAAARAFERAVGNSISALTSSK